MSVNEVNEIAAVSIRAEVTAQADDAILNSGKSELFVQIKLIEKMSQTLSQVIMLWNFTGTHT